MLSEPQRFLRLGAVTAALALALTACSSGTGGDSTPDGEAASGGHLTIVKTITMRSLDPTRVPIVTYGGSTPMNMIYDQLLYTKDGETVFVLAEDLTTVDGQNWTLTLNAGVEFSDGTPLTAESVKFTWERITDPELGSGYAGTAAKVASIEVVDDVTLNFELVSPNFNFPYLIETSALNWVVPEWADDDRDAFSLNPVGAGAFTVESWGSDDTLELTKNEGYWQDGLPKLDSITVLNNPDSSVTADMFRTGDAQVRLDAQRMDSAEVADLGGTELEALSQGGDYVGFNTATAPFDDERARRAVVAAFDTSAYNDVAYSGRNILVDTIVTSDSPWFDASISQEYDPELAQSLFDELAAEGKPVEFTFLANPTSASQGMAQLLTAGLGTFENVKVNVENADLVTFYPRVLGGDFQAALNLAQGPHPDTAFFDTFSSDGVANAGKWVDAEADAALLEGRGTDDEAAQIEAYTIAQQRIIDGAPVLWLTRAATVIALAPGVEGVILSSGGKADFTHATYTE